AAAGALASLRRAAGRRGPRAAAPRVGAPPPGLLGALLQFLRQFLSGGDTAACVRRASRSTEVFADTPRAVTVQKLRDVLLLPAGSRVHAHHAGAAADRLAVAGRAALGSPGALAAQAQPAARSLAGLVLVGLPGRFAGDVVLPRRRAHQDASLLDAGGHELALRPLRGLVAVEDARDRPRCHAASCAERRLGPGAARKFTAPADAIVRARPPSRSRCAGRRSR